VVMVTVSLVRGLDIDGGKGYLAPWADLREAWQIGGDDRPQLRVTANGLAIHQQDDRLASAGHLDAAWHETIRQDIVAARMGDFRPLQPHAHPIAAVRHAVRRGEERLDGFRGKEFL